MQLGAVSETDTAKMAIVLGPNNRGCTFSLHPRVVHLSCRHCHRKWRHNGCTRKLRALVCRRGSVPNLYTNSQNQNMPFTHTIDDLPQNLSAISFSFFFGSLNWLSNEMSTFKPSSLIQSGFLGNNPFTLTTLLW